MSDDTERNDKNSVRLLVAARHPFRLDDLGLDGSALDVQAQLVRRPDALERASEEASHRACRCPFHI